MLARLNGAHQDSSFAQRCREAMKSLLVSVSLSTKAGDDAAQFGDAARDGMLATKDLMALLEEFAAVASQADEAEARRAADALRQHVVEYVRLGKQQLASGGVNVADPAVQAAVRAVALGVKALLRAVRADVDATQPAAAATAREVPVRARNQLLTSCAQAGVDFDSVGGQATSDDDSEEVDRRVAERNAARDHGGGGRGNAHQKWAGAADAARRARLDAQPAVAPRAAATPPPAARAPAPAKAPVVLQVAPRAPDVDVDDVDDDALFGDLDECLNEGEAEPAETDAERDERRARLQTAVDLRAQTAADAADRAARIAESERAAEAEFEELAHEPDKPAAPSTRAFFKDVRRARLRVRSPTQFVSPTVHHHCHSAPRSHARATARDSALRRRRRRSQRLCVRRETVRPHICASRRRRQLTLRPPPAAHKR